MGTLNTDGYIAKKSLEVADKCGQSAAPPRRLFSVTRQFHPHPECEVVLEKVGLENYIEDVTVVAHSIPDAFYKAHIGNSSLTKRSYHYDVLSVVDLEQTVIL